MHRHLRTAFGALAICGSFLGLVVMIPVLAIGGRLGFPLEYLLFCAFALYIYGVWAGIKALKNDPNWRKYNAYFWAAQVPGLVTPTFAFLVSAAAGAWLYLRLSPTLGAGVGFYLGSGMQIAYAKGAGVTLLGVNVVALGLALFIRFYRRDGA